MVCDPPWGILNGNPHWDHFDPTDEHTRILVKNIAVVAQQRLNNSGVVFLFVPPTLVDINKNVVAISFKDAFERYVS